MIRLKSVQFWDILVLAIAVFFVIVKIPFLDYPYFWDEAWVYAPAVFDMFEGGPSLLPNSIDPELSRGHPILFHFFATCWMTLFGTSFIAVHSFTVFLSVCLIVSVYLLGAQIHSRAAGFWAAGFLAIQPIFLAQSGFLLPEVQLALFTVLTILFYLRRSLVPFIICGTCLLMTKETGILTIAVIGLVEFIQFMFDRELSRKRLLILGSVAVPIVLTFAYFLIQRFQFGWYMFPEHMSMFNTEPSEWKYKIGLAIEIVFKHQQRSLLIFAALAALGLGWSKGPLFPKVLAIILALSFVTMYGLNSWLPSWFSKVVLPLLPLLFAISMIKPLYREKTVNHLFFPISILLVGIMILFTSAHFFIDRYFLFLLPLMMLSVSVAIHVALRKAAVLKNVLLIFLGFMIYHHTSKIDAKQTNNNLRYVECIEVCQQAIRFLQNQKGIKDKCVTSTFTIMHALRKPVAGYVTEETIIPCSTNEYLAETEYILELSYDGLSDNLHPSEMPDFQEVWATWEGAEWAKVYKRKSP